MAINLEKMLDPISVLIRRGAKNISYATLPILAAIQIGYTSQVLASDNSRKNPQDNPSTNKLTWEQDNVGTLFHLENIMTQPGQADTIKSSGSLDDDCNCEPKYKRLEFREKTTAPTFKSKEIWTLNNNKGTDLFAIDCNNVGEVPLENILELVDFTDNRAKIALIRGEYDLVVDRHGREFAKLETNVGTRYFTIQSRDKEKQGAISINGQINYDKLESFGNTILRLYIGTAKGVRTKDGLVMDFEDSGDLLIPYFKCCEEIPPAKTEAIKEKIDTLIKVPEIPYEKLLAEANRKISELDSIQQKYLAMLEKLTQNKLHVDVIGGAFTSLEHEEDCGCSTINMDNNLMLFEIGTYGRIAGKLAVDAKLSSMHGKSDLKEMNGPYIGRFDITTSSFEVDGRLELIDLSVIGIGPGIIFEHNSATQKGNAKDIILDAGESRYSFLIGPAASMLHENGDVSAGIYYGYSPKTKNIAKAVLRAHNIGTEDFDIDGYAFFERHYTDRGKADRAGIDLRVAGPQIIGFLSPILGVRSEGMLHFYEKDKVSTGTLNSVYIGVRGNLGKFISK